MNPFTHSKLAFAVGAVLTASAVFADGGPVLKHPRAVRQPVPVVADEPNANEAAASPAVTSPCAAGTLCPPVNLTYSGSSVMLNLTDKGTNRGIDVALTNPANLYSAIFGSTVGEGPAVTGSNTGTVGVAGKFQINNPNSGAAALYGTTNGTGSAVFGLVSTTNEGNSAAVLGVNDEAGYFPVGVEGVTIIGTGVYGDATGSGGTGVLGQAYDGYGVYGSDGDQGSGVVGFSPNGIGVYGVSNSGYAGYFDGTVAATNYQSLSDRNAKTDFRPVSAKDILDRVDGLEITSWTFKNDSGKKRHVGPMAQDFHAAFGLNGADDKHINLTDVAGVSLAAIQALHAELAQKDAEMASLKALTETVAARMTALERQQSEVTTRTASTQVPAGTQVGQLD